MDTFEEAEERGLSLFPMMTIDKNNLTLIVFKHDLEVLQKDYLNCVANKYKIIDNKKEKYSKNIVFETEEYFKLALTTLRIAFPRSVAFYYANLSI